MKRTSDERPIISPPVHTSHRLSVGIRKPWIAVTESRVIHPSGAAGIYGTVHFKNRAVGVIPYEAGDIWLVGQHRFPLRAYSWEIPEGGVPFDEDLEQGARRELAEETGLVALRLDLIVRMHLSNSVSDEFGVVYLARELTPGRAAPEETETLAVRRIPLSEAYRMVEEGTITDSLSVAGILRLKLMSYEGKL
jgi:ADP-ribose pyrophosphatase